MSLEEILLGRGDAYPGLIPLIYAYLDIIECDEVTRSVVDDYLRLIADRARGLVPTPAEWMRTQVREHPDYKGDSVIPPTTAHDLLQKCAEIADGVRAAPDLLGFNAAAVQAGSARLAAEEAMDGRVPGSVKGKHFVDGAGEDAGKRMRGASFAEEIATQRDCVLVRALVSRYAVTRQRSFAATPAFLPIDVARPLDEDREAEEEGDA